MKGTETYQKINDGQIILSYKGSMNSDTIKHLIGLAESYILDLKAPKSIKKRLITIILESIQNSFHYIKKHLEDDLIKHSTFLIVSKPEDKGFKVVSGNCIKQETVTELEERILKINQMDEQELQAAYIKAIDKEVLPQKGGAGVGLIDIARKTKNKIFYNFEPINEEYSLFSLQVILEPKLKIKN